MIKDFVNKRLLKQTAEDTSEHYKEYITPEEFETVIYFFLEGVFTAIKQSKDVRLPYTGAFFVYAPAYEAEMKFRELSNAGVTDKEYIKKECDKIARETAIKLSQFNKRDIKAVRGKNVKQKPRTKRLPGQGEEPHREDLRRSFVTSKNLPSAWIERLNKRKK
jgi:hypothetical protein